MTATDVWNTVNTIDGQDIGKGTRAVLDALVKDGKALIRQSIDQKQSGWKFLSELIKEPKFWIWAIVLTVLFFGVSIADLKGLIGM